MLDVSSLALTRSEFSTKMGLEKSIKITLCAVISGPLHYTNTNTAIFSNYLPPSHYFEVSQNLNCESYLNVSIVALEIPPQAV